MGGKCGHSRPYEVSLSLGPAECRAAAFSSPFPTGSMRVSFCLGGRGPGGFGPDALAGPGWRGRPGRGQDRRVPTTRVLVVDDDAGIRELLGAALAFAGFETEAVGTVAGALTAMRERPPAILVLDVMLPDADGLEMLRLLRASGDRTPVLFLSARDTLADRMAGFAVGGDDYVTKPFDLGEVVARIRAVLRRGEGGDAVPDAVPDAAAENPPDGDVLRYADLLVDTGRMTVSRAGRPLELSPTEFRLLALLASAPERVVSKAQLLDRLWSYDFGGDASVIEKVVSRLRRKLDPPDLPPLLRTVRGFGYALRADVPGDPGGGDA